MKGPYLGSVYKEATQYELFNNDTIDKGAEDQLTLQICKTLVIIDQQQPESPKRTREPWVLESTPTITPATYTAQ
jgi:hypothetical protein